jgi:hypothetical protein
MKTWFAANRGVANSPKEKQVRPVYALVIGNGKLNLQKASADDQTTLRVVDGDFVLAGQQRSTSLTGFPIS